MTDDESDEYATRDDIKEAHARMTSIESQLDEIQNTLDSMRGRIRMVETVQSRGESAVQTYRAVLRNAANRARGSSRERSGVAMNAQDIVTATGCSRQHSYEVMTSMADEYEFCRVRDAKDIPNRQNRKKSLVVEVEDNREFIEFLLRK